MTVGGETKSGALGSHKVQYGDFQFSEYTNTRLRISPVWDDTDSIITKYKCSLSVESIINKGFLETETTSNDLTINTLEKYLLTPSKELTIQHVGVGSHSILPSNSNGSATFYGVKPRECVLENLGDGQCSRVTWEAEFFYRAEQIEVNRNNIQAFIISIRHSAEVVINDRQRLEQRETYQFECDPKWENAISGQGRVKDVKSKVEEVLRKVVNDRFPAPFKMSLANTSWGINISTDRRLITITRRINQIDSDVEYPSVVFDMELSHKVSSSIEQGFQEWDNEIAGSIELFPGQPPELAWLLYQSIFRQRFERGFYQSIPKKGYKNTSKVTYPRITNISIEDKLTNVYRIGFSVKYLMIVPSLNSLLSVTGLFSPINTNQFNAIYGGNSQERPNANPTLVYRSVPIKVEDNIRDGMREYHDDTTPDFTDLDNVASLIRVSIPYITQTTCPPPEDSWLDYKVKVVMLNNRRIHQHSRYTDVTKINAVSNSDYYQGIRLDQQTERGTTDGSDLIHHVVGSNNQRLQVRGYALRYGSATNPPDISVIDNYRVELIKEQVDDTIISSSACPLHLTKWVKDYYIVGTVAPGQDITSGVDQSISPERYQYG